MSLRIHAYPSTPRAFKALVVANHLGVDYEFAFCDLMAGVQKSETFTALNPNQKMPVLEDGAFVLWESNAIMQYLASKKPGALTPTDERGRADVLRWQFWDATTWDPACTKLIFQRVVKQNSTWAGLMRARLSWGCACSTPRRGFSTSSSPGAISSAIG